MKAVIVLLKRVIHRCEYVYIVIGLSVKMHKCCCDSDCVGNVIMVCRSPLSLLLLFCVVMASLTSVPREGNASSIPVLVRARHIRNKSPDLPMQKNFTESNEITDAGTKRRIFHRRTNSHDVNAAMPMGHKAKSKCVVFLVYLGQWEDY